MAEGERRRRSHLATRRGRVSLPAYLPLLSGDPARGLERALLSYLPRLAGACVAGLAHPALSRPDGAVEEAWNLPRMPLGVLGDLLDAGEGGPSSAGGRDAVDL